MHDLALPGERVDGQIFENFVEEVEVEVYMKSCLVDLVRLVEVEVKLVSSTSHHAQCAQHIFRLEIATALSHAPLNPLALHRS